MVKPKVWTAGAASPEELARFAAGDRRRPQMETLAKPERCRGRDHRWQSD